MMKTTLNIDVGILKKITSVAVSRGVSPSELIVILLKKLMNDVNNPGEFGRLVRYQERKGPDDWHTFHIKYRIDDYEYFQDMRRLRKMSVSFLLAYAVKRYLNKVVKDNIGDNYHQKNYIIIKELVDNIICWKFYWGFPLHIERIL
ncbi:MAG: hypothetical protein JW807_03495 [Spirochaetes bacterium]|nr:hypothetical protein [Spirochaetota bacterium]